MVARLEVAGVSKSFPGVRALRDVSLELQPAEVLAVIGENGAGKSTLMRILAGIQQPDQGEIFVAGQRVQFSGVAAAQQAGIVLIHQELNLCDNLSVAANLFLGREPGRWGWIDRTATERRARHVLSWVGLDVPLEWPLRRLSVGQQQMVEIAKALAIDAGVLIMDEPTSSLSQREAQRLFATIADLKRRGTSVIYVSHRLSEVRRVADRVMVLRDGCKAGELVPPHITHDAMVRLMVGRDLSQLYARHPHRLGEVVLDLHGLRTQAFPRQAIDLQVRAGEIVGLAGLVGAGRTELLRAIFGADRPVGGSIRIRGELVARFRPAAAIAAGAGLVPEDRKTHGLILEMTVAENLSLAACRSVSGPAGWLRRGAERQLADRVVRDLAIGTPHRDQRVVFLSGGNQQKVVVGKWLALQPRLLLLDEPTRGVDVGAKHEIYALIDRLAGEGMAVLFASSELEEIMGLADRCLVLHEGRLTGEMGRSEWNEERIMQCATGQVMVVSGALGPVSP
jgi:ribose transport system ATP-binding protein